jgi:hypothetical protein
MRNASFCIVTVLTTQADIHHLHHLQQTGRAAMFNCLDLVTDIFFAELQPDVQYQRLIISSALIASRYSLTRWK